MKRQLSNKKEEKEEKNKKLKTSKSFHKRSSNTKEGDVNKQLLTINQSFEKQRLYSLNQSGSDQTLDVSVENSSIISVDMSNKLHS